MKEVEHEQELCFNRYSNALKELNKESQEHEKHRHHHNNKQPEEVSYQKKKRHVEELSGDDGVKKVCW